MASRLYLVVLMIVSIALMLGCSCVTFASAAEHEQQFVDNQRRQLPPASSSSASSSVSDSLGLTILREYKALESQPHYQQQLHFAASPSSSLLPDPYPPHYALGFPSATISELNAMSNKELRRYISERGGRCDGCMEKVHLLERAIALRGVPTRNEEIVAMLTPYATAAPIHLPKDILRPMASEEVQAAHHASLSTAALKDPRYVCEVVERQEEGAVDPTSEAGYSPMRTVGGDDQHAHGRVRRNANGMYEPPEIHCRPRTFEDDDE